MERKGPFHWTVLYLHINLKCQTCLNPGHPCMANTEAFWVLCSEHMALVHVQHFIKRFFSPRLLWSCHPLRGQLLQHVSSPHLAGMLSLLFSLLVCGWGLCYSKQTAAPSLCGLLMTSDGTIWLLFLIPHTKLLLKHSNFTWNFWIIVRFFLFYNVDILSSWSHP